MAIVKMSKFNLLSFGDKRENLLKTLQNFNYVHFNDLYIDDKETYLTEVKNTKALQAIDEKLNKLKFTMDTIKKFSKLNYKQELKSFNINQIYSKALNFDFLLIYDELVDLVKKRDKLLDENKILEKKIKDLYPWKDISINIDSLYESKNFYLNTGSVSSQFYDALKKSIIEKKLKESLVYRLSQNDKISYIVALSSLKEEDDFKEILREFGFSKIVVKTKGSVDKELSSVKIEKQENDLYISDLETQIGDFDKYFDDFFVYESFLNNEKRKQESAEFFLKTDSMDIIEGYVPSSMVSKFKKDLEEILDYRYILDIKDADKEDSKVPIILENNSIVKPYESVVSTYALPRYGEIDPSSLVAIFYTIFTGFMIGDLGYGLLGVIATLSILKLKDMPESSKKTVQLFLGISLSAFFFGILFGSVFGGIIDVPFGWIDTQTDINTLIVISLIIGGVALFTALAMKAYMYIRDGKVLDAIYDVLFWYMAVGGPIAYVLVKNNIFLYIMAIGMIGIVLFAGRENKSFAARFGSGLYDLYGITSWVGDFVSFLRLMALVLSGGFVAYAVNVIVKMVFGAGLGGIIGGIIIFVVFQLFNMFLSYLSAYVHSLRLIYVEMFGKFYEGGGMKFREMFEDTKKIIINRGEKNDRIFN